MDVSLSGNNKRSDFIAVIHYDKIRIIQNTMENWLFFISQTLSLFNNLRLFTIILQITFIIKPLFEIVRVCKIPCMVNLSNIYRQ